MKPKNFILLILAVAIVCGVLWWFTRSTMPVPGKIAEVPMPTKSVAPKQVAPQAIAPPIASPAPKPDMATAQSAATPSPDPNASSIAELTAVITDIARLYREGDFVTLEKTYTPPDKLDPQYLQELQNSQTYLQGNPDLLRMMYGPLAQAYEDMETQTPNFNSAGDEATYIITQQPFQMRDGTTAGKVDQSQMTFIKINGNWYRKRAETGD